jgi:hypothetical protein
MPNQRSRSIVSRSVLKGDAARDLMPDFIGFLRGLTVPDGGTASTLRMDGPPCFCASQARY